MAETAATEKTGRCLCGAVVFKATPAPHDDGVHVDACHCGMCRRQIGGPLMAVTTAGPVTVEDPTHLGVYRSSDWAERCFCKKCGSNLFWRMRDGSFTSVNAGAFDDTSDAKLTLEIFIDEKPGYYDFAGERKRMTGDEVLAAFAGGGTASGESASGAGAGKA